MRVRGLAFIGLVVGAFIASPSCTFVSATAVQPHITSSQSSIEKFFSSDAPESLHEAKNQGTADEPKAWPEANAWLHASLSETEREFLSLAVTGSVPSGANPNGGLTSTQISDTSATITVQVRFFRSTQPDPTTLRNQLVASIPGSTTNSVSQPVFTVTTIGNGVYWLATFQFTSVGSFAGGQHYTALTSQFSNSVSALRLTSSFQDIDLSFYPTAFYTAGSTPTPGGTNAYCTANPSTCLNGGSCVNTPTTSPFYTCTCPSGFIGQQCQFNLFSNSKRNKIQGVLPRGRSVTRPNKTKRTNVKLVQ